MLGKVNEDFLLMNLENKKNFAELCVHAENPEEVVELSKKTLQNMGYFIASIDSQSLDGRGIEKLINAEEDTPSKSLIKGVKKVNLGSKHPRIWKLGFGFSTLTFLYYLFFATIPTQLMIGTVMAGSAILSAGAFLAREKINLTLWIKIIGINKKEKNGRYKVFLAGEPANDNPVANDQLSENFAEIKDNYKRYFINHEGMGAYLNPSEGVSGMMESMKELQARIDALNKNLEKDGVSEKEYEKKITDLEKQRANMLLAVELLSRTR